MTRETVATETPARRATSLMVVMASRHAPALSRTLSGGAPARCENYYRRARARQVTSGRGPARRASVRRPRRDRPTRIGPAGAGQFRALLVGEGRAEMEHRHQ